MQPPLPHQELIEAIRKHPAVLYRDAWGTATGFDSLPTVSRADLLRTPLSQRRYKDERALVKIVRDAQGRFLSEWSFSDIGAEHFGLASKRPFVYLSDPYEAIEKSMWCYERGMVPLVGEKDPDIAAFAAAAYRVDSLITDTAAIGKLLPFLEKSERLASISILGEAFDADELQRYRQFAEVVRLVLALPETGAFAACELSDSLHFAVLPECTVEREETLIVTKHRLLVTPVIRYRTHIPQAVYGA